MFGWSRAEAAFASWRNRCFRGVVSGQIGRQDFDRHLAVEARIVGRVDDPHAAVAEFAADRVRGRGWRLG